MTYVVSAQPPTDSLLTKSISELMRVLYSKLTPSLIHILPIQHKWKNYVMQWNVASWLCYCQKWCLALGAPAKPEVKIMEEISPGVSINEPIHFFYLTLLRLSALSLLLLTSWISSTQTFIVSFLQSYFLLVSFCPCFRLKFIYICLNIFWLMQSYFWAKLLHDNNHSQTTRLETQMEC